MLDMLQFVSGMGWASLGLAVLIFDVPRYTFSLLSLSLGVLFRGSKTASRLPNTSVSVIVPTFNGGSGLTPTIASLRAQSLPLHEIIVVDDGSTDNTRLTAQRAHAEGMIDMVICHGTRCGRSAAINSAARFATGELILTVDADTVFAPDAIARLASVFVDRRVGGASCNIAISNEPESIWTALQSMEYLMSISAGRAILDIIGAIACLSGACSMYRRSIFIQQGGLDVGPGEDLEFSLRLRRLGYRIRFVPEAWAETDGPVTGISLLRQRARWDRDALRIRFMMYGEFGLRHPLEHFRDTLQRLDFILFDLIPTLSFPFYTAYLVLLFGGQALPFLLAVYLLLLWISLFNIGVAFLLYGRSSSLFGLAISVILPFYQGIYLKCARFVSYSSEIIFATSRHDDFVPPRVRRALLANRGPAP